MRTLSSRLSIRRVRRSVPRCSDSSRSPSRSRGMVSRPSSISSTEASCAASGVRNSCEMFASTESRARRTASSSVSSRRTCTCRPARRRGARDDDGSRRAARVEVFRRLRLAVVARRVDRAAEVAGAPAIDVARFQHVAAELADELGRGRAEHFRGLRVQVTDAPVGIHRIDALDHALQHGLGLGLAMAQRRRQVHEVAPHVFHRARERLDFLRALGRDRGGEIALAEPLRGGGERLQRRADAAREHERNEERNER